MNRETQIEASSLSFSYRRPTVKALDDVTFSIPRGSFTAIMGPNGSGKTTLVRLILGLLTPESGDLTIEGFRPWIEQSAVQRLIGYIPQSEQVNDRLPVRLKDVVLQGVLARGGPAKGLTKRLDEILVAVGLEEFSDVRFGTLSGGQQQRTLIARALAVEPRILLLDEPFAAVDVSSQQSITELLSDIRRERDVTVITVVHNINVLVHHLDYVMLLDRRLVAMGPPAEVLSPETLKAVYKTDVPVVVCDDGFFHPMLEDTHGKAR
jgi:ABC-type Mn2+/Zn2+ transport system ATPase subunit